MSWKNMGMLLGLLTVAFAAVFLVFPEIDLAVSSVFYITDGGFWLRYNAVFEAIRFVFIDGLTLLAILVFALFIHNMSIGARRVVPLAVWGFLSASFLLGPILLVNGVLKAFWGRARPTDIEYFGGDASFSPPILISDQCASNCSFVSGEGSAISTAVIVLAIVLWPNMGRIWRIVSLWILAPFATFGIALRIITGRHFLSDTIFAVLFCALIIWALYRAFDMKNHRGALTWATFRRDLLKK